jgi:hypothetical protein
MIQNNPLISNFNGYMTQNPNTIPFQGNQLINENVHVMNNLNDFVQHHKSVQQNMGMYQQQLMAQQQQMNSQFQVNNQGQTNYQSQMNNQQMRGNPQSNSYTASDSDDNYRSQRENRSKSTGKKTNIIEEMLKPQKILKNNKDVKSNYSVRNDKQKNEKFELMNLPYKNIIRDKVIPKSKNDGKFDEKEFIVHKTKKGIDDNVEVFEKELKVKIDDKEKVNDELQIEFHIDKYETHKKNFEYKHSFIRTAAYEAKDFSENREDYIEFYRKHQKQVEDGLDLCDKIFKSIEDSGLIEPGELPTANLDDTKTGAENIDLDLNKVLQKDSEPELPSEKVSSRPPGKSPLRGVQKPSLKNTMASKTTDMPKSSESTKPVPTRTPASSNRPTTSNNKPVPKTNLRASNRDVVNI